jgi:S1-C subfamily serine protease
VRRVLVAAAVLLLWGTGAAATVRNLGPRTDSDGPSVVLSTDQLTSAAVRIDGRGGGRFDIGSGVGIAPGVVLTNAHLTNDPATFVTRRDESVLPIGRIEQASKGLDLAVVVTNAPVITPIVLAPEDPAPGEHVTMVGYPWGERTITDARIEGTLVRGDVTVLRFSPEPHPGQSGSPLIDARGRLVGIAFAEDTVGGQGLAIPVSDVHAAVEAWRADGIPVG